MSASNKDPVPSLCVAILHAEGIKDTQMFAPQDPYAIVTLLPSGTQERTRHVEAGGTDPKWNVSHGNELVLALAGEDTRLRMELWNLNTFVDDLIGSVELELDVRSIANQEVSAYGLDTGGKLWCTIHRREDCLKGVSNRTEEQNVEEDDAEEQFRGAFTESGEQRKAPPAAPVAAMVVAFDENKASDSSNDRRPSSTTADFRPCIVQLGIFDRTKGRVVSWGSGSVISAHGHILTAAHVLHDFVGGKDRYAMLVGVFEPEGSAPRWTYSCTIASDEKALQLKAADESLVDLAVLQIKAKIMEANPPTFDGSLQSLTIVKEAMIEPTNLSMRYLPTSKAKLKGDCNVRLFGYPKQRGNIRLTREKGVAAVQDAGWVKVNATAVATSGCSGGPLLNDTGEVVAVMSKDYNDKKGHAQALNSGMANLSWFRHLSMIQPGHRMPESEQEMPADLAVDAARRDYLAATAEQEALAKDILHLLSNTQSHEMGDGREHIKAGNLEQALECFKQVVQASASPEELAKAKKLLMYVLFKLGIKHLQNRKYDQAAEQFGEILNQPLHNFLKERLQKLWFFHACALYEAGKQHREDGDWGEAKRRFEAAKKTKALPNKLQGKNAAYLKECKQKCKDIDDNYEDLDESDDADLIDKTDADAANAFKVYKQAKRSMENGMAGRARQQFEKAKEIGLPKALKKRAKKFLQALDEYEGQEATQCVFSDNCTNLLGSSQLTLGFATATLGLSTNSVSANRRVPKDMVMVLDEIFPAGSAERKKLIVQLTTDVRKALATINKAAEIEIRDLIRGSVIVHFCFVSDEAGYYLEEEYLRQVDDKESPIYEGEVTQKIDQERTTKMTLQLNENRGELQDCPYQVGDTITLAQITQDEKIECKVDAKLGEGATSTVFKVTTGGKTRALKVFKAEKSLEDLCKEASLMLTSSHPDRHPNVLRADFVWYEQRTNKMFFLMGLVNGDDLQTWMDDERLYAGTDAEQAERLILIVHQLACGLRHYHLRAILHGDFKPDNVLMTRTGIPVIGDLGVGNVGTIADGKVKAGLRGGTPVYASPNVRKLFFQAKALPVAERKDLLKQHPVTHLDDFFALGATILDMFAECGWRRGQSVADVLGSPGSVDRLVNDTKLMRVAVPEGMIEVLQTCFSADDSLTVNSIVELTAKLCKQPPPTTVEGMLQERYANIRNNLGVALYDSGAEKQKWGNQDYAIRNFEAAHAQLEHAITAQPDNARTLNNLGVIKWAQGMVNEARRRFDDALAADPEHAAAVSNVALVQGRREGTAQLDRTGAVGAVEDNHDEVELARAVSFAPGQPLEVYRGGKWEQINAGGRDIEKSLIDLVYRVPPDTKYFAAKQQLMVLQQGKWRLGVVHSHFGHEYDQAVKKEEEAEVKQQKAKAKQHEAEAKQHEAEAKRHEAEAERHEAEARKHEAEALQLSTRHAILFEGHRDHNPLTIDLDEANHAPALFFHLAAMSRAQQAHTIELKDKHAFILDLFSGQKLSVRTQTAALRYYEKERAAQILSRDDDIDAPKYQLARQKSLEQVDSVPAHTLPTNGNQQREALVMHRSKDAVTVLQEMLGGDDRTAVRLRPYLLLILGPAASGKTTLLKTFMIEMVDVYPDFVPVLMPIIEVVRMLDTCNRDEGESVVSAFIRRNYPKHKHLLLQMVLLRRAVFLVDGIDESGTHREDVQHFITVELLEPGHKTIITSRHSGFSSEAFKQCRLVELLPLSPEQQAEMVRTRVLDDEKAAELVKELGTVAFKDIASNPLMLTMMVSVYVSNNFVVISNRSELYEKALRTLMGRTDKHRAGLELATQEELLAHLQMLASASHGREGERRIFTAAQANEWAGPNGWVAIEGAMQDERLPIIVLLGPNDKGEEEYRFGHMSYQEYLTGREYYRKLTESHFSADTMVELFGKEPKHAFAEVKYHLVLELLAGILSPEQRATCLAVMAGGRVERATVTAKATVYGGDILVITKELGRAGAETLALYLTGAWLKTLVLRKVKLGANGMQVLAEGLETNATLTALDVSENELGAEGAKHVAVVIPECKALTDLNISNNNIGDEKVWVDGWKPYSGKEFEFMRKVAGSYEFKNELAEGLPRQEFLGATAIAHAIKTNGVLVKFDISNNAMKASGGIALAEVLKDNNVMTFLNVAGNKLSIKHGTDHRRDMSGLIAIGNTIPTMGALTSLNISNNNIGELVLPQGWTQREGYLVWNHVDGREVKGSENKPAGKPVGVIALADGIMNNGALTSLNVSDNQLCGHWKTPNFSGFNALISAIEQHELLAVEAINMGESLDVSGQKIDPAGAKLMATFIQNNGALMVLNISNNNIGELVPPAGWSIKDKGKSYQQYVHTDGREQRDAPEGTKPDGAIALADAISTNGALVKFDISKNRLYVAGAKALAEAMRENQVMTELNIADNGLGKTSEYSSADMSGIIAIGDAIPTMAALETITFGDKQAVTLKTIMTEVDFSGKELGVSGAIIVAAFLPKCLALTSLHIGNNQIPVENVNEMIAIVEAKPAMKILCAVLFRDKNITELDFSSQSLGVEGALVIRRYLENNGALTSLNISKNGLLNKQAGKVLGDMLKANSVLKELDVSGSGEGMYDSQKDAPGFAKELAAGVSTNGALTSLNISSNNLGQLVFPAGWEFKWVHKGTQAANKWVHADGREQQNKPAEEPAGAIAIAEAIPTMGALVTLNILKNRIGEEGLEPIVNAWKASKSLKSICGTTSAELNLSGQNLGDRGDIPVVCAEIENNGALTSLDISANAIASKEAGKALAEVLKTNTVLKELDVSDNLQKDWKGDVSRGDGPGFAKELAAGVSTNAALTSLNISSNAIGYGGVEGVKALVEAIKVNVSAL